jgi:hypothetical protein
MGLAPPSNKLIQLPVALDIHIVVLVVGVGRGVIPCGPVPFARLTLLYSNLAKSVMLLLHS